jgi:hypothetical protein
VSDYFGASNTSPLSGSELSLRGVIQNEIHRWQDVVEDNDEMTNDEAILDLAEHLAKVLIRERLLS